MRKDNDTIKNMHLLIRITMSHLDTNIFLKILFEVSKNLHDHRNEDTSSGTTYAWEHVRSVVSKITRYCLGQDVPLYKDSIFLYNVSVGCHNICELHAVPNNVYTVEAYNKNKKKRNSSRCIKRGLKDAWFAILHSKYNWKYKSQQKVFFAFFYLLYCLIFTSNNLRSVIVK